MNQGKSNGQLNAELVLAEKRIQELMYEINMLKQQIRKLISMLDKVGTVCEAIAEFVQSGDSEDLRI